MKMSNYLLPALAAVFLFFQIFFMQYALLKETHDTLLKMQEDSKKESAIESKRFIIQTVLSVASLIVAAIAAVASIIALL